MHELEVQDGQAAMFYVGETPWHKLGTRLPLNPTPEDAIAAAKIDWTVSLKKLVTEDGTPVPGKMATVRESDGKVLGVVGKDWRVFQNKDAVEWFRPLIEQGNVTLETAGSLRGGRRIWVLGRLTGVETREVVPGDPVNPYIQLANGHDGSLAIHLGFTCIRTVCANTLAMALSKKNSKLLKIRHTANSQAAVENVREIMLAANQTFEASVEKYKMLSRLGVSKESLRKYVDLVFEIDEKKANAKTDEERQKAVAASERLYQKVVPLFEKGRGNDAPGVAGTMWGAYNAVSEFLAYDRGRNDSTRLDSLWFGDAANINARALEVGLTIKQAA